MVNKIILFQPDKICFKSFDKWTEDIKKMLNECDVHNKAGINNLAVVTNQISLIYYLLNDIERSEKICFMGYNFFKDKYTNLRCQESLNIFLQPLINIVRLNRLKNNRDLQKKYIKKIFPKKITINHSEIFDNLNDNSKKILEINFILEYSRLLINENPKLLVKIIDKYRNIYSSIYEHEINDAKILALMQYNIKDAFIFSCECYKKYSNFYKYYYLFRILQCQIFFGNSDIYEQLFEKISFEIKNFLIKIGNKFNGHFDLFYNFAKLSSENNKNYNLIKIFYDYSLKYGDELSELMFSRFLKKEDIVKNIENTSMYSCFSNKQNYLSELELIYKDYLKLMRT